MILGPVAIKIRAANTRFANRVFGTAELPLAMEFTQENGSPLKAESAFVIPLAEGCAPNTYDNGINQKVMERFGVLTAIKNDGAATEKLGTTAFDVHDSVRAELFAAVLGWLIPSTSMPVYYMGGRLVDANPAYLWYLYEFQCETDISDADGVSPALGPYDDFLKVYTQWLVGSEEQAILPLTGTAPQLPTALVAPRLADVIDLHYPFGSGFGLPYDTLETEAK